LDDNKSRSELKDHVAIQRKFEVKYFHKIKAILDKELDAVISIVEKQGIPAAINHVGYLINLKGLTGIIEQLYVEVGGRFARRTWIEIRKKETKGFGFNARWVQWILDYLREHLIDKITFRVTETLRTVLLTALNKAFTEGWGIKEAVKFMRDQEKFPLTKTQAARIARTESTRATNTGIYAAGQTSPFEQTKEWIATFDKRTRGQEKKPHASHVLLNGQKIDLEDFFVDPVNGDQLLFPGDPEGSAASVINCRCVIALRAKRDENGRLIPKKVNEWQLQFR
jgi:hypothetical protein